jgi:hypothetical protein
MLVRLVCWNEDEARERVESLAGSGFEIDGSPFKVSGLITHFKKLAPAAVLIDLDRKPSYGQAVAGMLRQSPSTRHLPLVLAGGAPEKLERIRKELPDVVFVEWKNAARALKKAIAHPVINPALPVPHMMRYQGSGLITKLGLKPNQKVALIAPPEGFEELVGEWPEGCEIQPKFTGRTELAIWFIRSAREMVAVADHLGVRLRKGVSAWICYPKKAGRHKVDFNGFDVRAACLEVGLVDYKICAIDADWTGMKFTRKRS